MRSLSHTHTLACTVLCSLIRAVPQCASLWVPGREAQEFYAKISSGEPMYTSSAEVQPVVTAAGLRRPIAFPS